MPLDRRSFVKGAGIAAGTVLVPGTAAGFVDDAIDTDGGLQEVIIIFGDNDDVDALEAFDLAEGYYRFRVLPFAYTKATGEQIQEIAALDSVRYVEKNKELSYHNDDARETTGVQAAHDELLETGAGAHTVVIDSGVDGYHLDLKPNLENNFRYVNPLSSPEETMWVDVGDGDSDDIGHGTHCSGTVAGTGEESDGRFAGMAPDADLTVYSAGLTVYIVKIAGAVDDMIARKRSGDLDAQVVSNSYGLSNDYDFNPVSASNLAMWKAFDSGILPVFSAGNSGTDHGTLNYAVKAPYILGVAATHDGDFGPAKKPTGFSSRGRPPADEKGEGYASDYDRSYDAIEGAHYDRETALDNVRAFHREGPKSGDKLGKRDQDEFSMLVPYGVNPAYNPQYGPSNYQVWGPHDDAGYIESTVTWRPPGQAITLIIHESPKERSAYSEDELTDDDLESWPVVGSGGELVSDGEFTLANEIDGDRLYAFELEGEYNALSEATVSIAAWEDNDVEGPFGIYRNGVGAPGNAVMSTETYSDGLKFLGPLYGGDDGADPWYGALSGTSMSCPVTSGICTLVNAAYRREAGRFPKPVDVLNIVEATADAGTDAELAVHSEANMGAGFVDAEAAVELARDLGTRAPSLGGTPDYTEPDHPGLWNRVELCDRGRGEVILDVTGRRTDDGSAFTAGQTNHVEITLTDTTERLVEVRDAIPSNWQVESGNYDRVETDGDVTYVYFDADFDGSGEVTFDYFAEAPEETARYGFGPAEVRAADADEFVAVPNTTDTNAVAGQEQP